MFVGSERPGEESCQIGSQGPLFFAWTTLAVKDLEDICFVLHPEKIGCVGCNSIILQVKIDVKRHRRTWWGCYIKPTHCATKYQKQKLP